MGFRLITAAACLAGAFLFTSNRPGLTAKIPSGPNNILSTQRLVDFRVLRMSGGRVLITWHTERESANVSFEVMRKHGRGTPYVSLGIVQPKSGNINSADYSFIDINEFADSSFYRVKKTNADDVVFYSLAKGIEGLGRERY